MNYAMIGELERQNKNTKKLIEQLEKKDKRIDELSEKLLKVMDKYTELHNTIDKARDYIENNSYDTGSNYTAEIDVDKLLEILEIK